jgi:predicted transcriptional regulator
MPKRSKDQIIAQILTTCREGASKTKVVYQVNLNFKTINPHLYLLIEKGLLEVIQGKFILYKTTTKGERALECLREIEEIYS